MESIDKTKLNKKILIDDLRYPDSLKTIKNPPQQLYCKGDLSLFNTPCLAVVGSRKATPYGKWAAYNIAKRAAEHGVTIVSGMASGIDTCGHMGALDGKGKTIAVLGCGPDICYPRKNRELMHKIEKRGLVITEYPPGRQPLPGQFPARNRIISGLSYGVVIVEADLQSGSIITAGAALDQGKEVYAVPGNINSPYSKGTNKLIQDGATPLIDVDDILDFLNIRDVKSRKADLIELDEDEKIVMKILEAGSTITMDQLCILTKKQPAEIAALVTILEMKGKLRRSMGKIHVAKYEF